MEAHLCVPIHGWRIWTNISLSDDLFFLLLSWTGNLKSCHLSQSPLLILGEKAPAVSPDGVRMAAAKGNTMLSHVVSLPVLLRVCGHLAN